MYAKFPHCDARILHAPGECKYCDYYPSAQAARVTEGVNFTGHYDDDKELCPSEAERPLPIIEKWPGNRAYPEGI